LLAFTAAFTNAFSYDKIMAQPFPFPQQQQPSFPQQQGQSLIPYENPELGVRILYPSGAQYVPTGERNIIRFDSLYPPFVIMVMVKPADGQTLDQVKSQLEEEIVSSGLSVIGTEEASIANNPGYRIYVSSPDGQLLSIMGFTVINDVIYGLQFQMENLYLETNIPLIQQIEASFEILQSCPDGFQPGTSGMCEEIQQEDLQSSNNILLYENPELGFNIGYPSDAEIQEEELPEGSGFVTFLLNEGSVDIAVEKGIQNMSLQEYTDNFLEEFLPVLGSDAQITSEIEPLTLTANNYPAMQTYFTFTDEEGSRYVGYLVSSVIDDIGYTLVFITGMEDTDNFVPIVDMMLGSFDVPSVGDLNTPNGNVDAPPIDIPF
jgi:hypothetical protein